MQFQSAAEPPRKVAAGERAVQADGNDYSLTCKKTRGGRSKPVYATEGTPIIIVRNRYLQERAQSERGAAVPAFLFSPEGQQILVDYSPTARSTRR